MRPMRHHSYLTHRPCPLPPSSQGGSFLDTVDPYVSLEVRSGRPQKSKTIDNNPNPAYQERFSFIVDDYEEQTLHVKVGRQAELAEGAWPPCWGEGTHARLADGTKGAWPLCSFHPRLSAGASQRSNRQLCPRQLCPMHQPSLTQLVTRIPAPLMPPACSLTPFRPTPPPTHAPRPTPHAPPAGVPRPLWFRRYPPG